MLLGPLSPPKELNYRTLLVTVFKFDQMCNKAISNYFR